MSKIVKIIKTDRIISGSIILVSGSLLGSFTNYLYHLVTARFLGPKDYGILDSLISLIYVLNVPLSTLSLVIAKYVSSFKGQGRDESIKSFYLKILKKLISLFPFGFFAFLISTPIVVKFLHLPSPFLYIWIWVGFLLNVYSVMARSFLQGLSKFLPLTLAGFAENFLRLLLTVLFLILGFNLIGAVFPFAVISLFSVLFSFYLTKFLLKNPQDKYIPEKKEILKYIFPVFICNISLISLISSDVILARHFLKAEEAGFYSALSTLSKILFFAVSPIVNVLFPTISEIHSSKGNFKKSILTGFVLIGVIVGSVFAIFYTFPQQMVFLLFGSRYYGIIPYLLYFIVGMSFYSLSYVFANILLALKKTTASYLIAFAGSLQIIALFLFPKTIFNFVIVFLSVSSLLFISLLIFFWRNIRFEK